MKGWQSIPLSFLVIFCLVGLLNSSSCTIMSFSSGHMQTGVLDEETGINRLDATPYILEMSSRIARYAVPTSLLGVAVGWAGTSALSLVATRLRYGAYMLLAVLFLPTFVSIHQNSHISEIALFPVVWLPDHLSLQIIGGHALKISVVPVTWLPPFALANAISLVFFAIIPAVCTFLILSVRHSLQPSEKPAHHTICGTGQSKGICAPCSYQTVLWLALSFFSGLGLLTLGMSRTWISTFAEGSFVIGYSDSIKSSSLSLIDWVPGITLLVFLVSIILMIAWLTAKIYKMYKHHALAWLELANRTRLNRLGRVSLLVVTTVAVAGAVFASYDTFMIVAGAGVGVLMAFLALQDTETGRRMFVLFVAIVFMFCTFILYISLGGVDGSYVMSEVIAGAGVVIVGVLCGLVLSASLYFAGTYRLVVGMAMLEMIAMLLFVIPLPIALEIDPSGDVMVMVIAGAICGLAIAPLAPLSLRNGRSVTVALVLAVVLVISLVLVLDIGYHNYERYTHISIAFICLFLGIFYGMAFALPLKISKNDRIMLATICSAVFALNWIGLLILLSIGVPYGASGYMSLYEGLWLAPFCGVFALISFIVIKAFLASKAVLGVVLLIVGAIGTWVIWTAVDELTPLMFIYTILVVSVAMALPSIVQSSVRRGVDIIVLGAGLSFILFAMYLPAAPLVGGIAGMYEEIHRNIAETELVSLRVLRGLLLSLIIAYALLLSLWPSGSPIGNLRHGRQGIWTLWPNWLTRADLALGVAVVSICITYVLVEVVFSYHNATPSLEAPIYLPSYHSYEIREVANWEYWFKMYAFTFQVAVVAALGFLLYLRLRLQSGHDRLRSSFQ